MKKYNDPTDLVAHDDHFTLGHRMYRFDQIAFILSLTKKTTIKYNFVEAGSQELSVFCMTMDDQSECNLVGEGVWAPTLFRFNKQGIREAAEIHEICKIMQSKSFSHRLKRYEDAYEELGYFDLQDGWMLHKNATLTKNGKTFSMMNSIIEEKGPCLTFTPRENRSFGVSLFSAMFGGAREQLAIFQDTDVAFHLLNKYLFKRNG